MGAVVSLATAPMTMAAQCCGSLAGGCAASLLCKACSCSCVATPRMASGIYFATLAFCVFIAMWLDFYGGDIVLGGGYNTTEESILDRFKRSGTQGAEDFWNKRFYCAPAHPSGLIICCKSICAGVFVVYRVSWALCVFFAVLTLLTAGTTKFGARAHRGFWFLKLFCLLTLLVSSVFIDNPPMETYREFARYTSFLFLIMQILLLIDFGYRTNEWLVELDERSDNEDKFCSWKICLLGCAVALYALSITGWVLMSQWFGMDGCGPQQALIALTIVLTISLSIISCTKIAPHGTLLTSAVVTAYATYQCYSALAANPDPNCNAIEHSNASDLLVGFVVFAVAMLSMAGAAWSATSSKDQILGKATSTSNSDLTVNLDTGAGGASDGSADEEVVGPESWWYYHLMMVISSLYMAMLLTNWSVQPVNEAPSLRGFSVSLESFWIKIVAQWVCLLMYGWTLLAPYLLRNVRDFGIEFDFD